MHTMRRKLLSLILIIAMTCGCAPRTEVQTELDTNSDEYKKLAEVFHPEVLRYCNTQGVNPSMIHVVEGKKSSALADIDPELGLKVTRVEIAEDFINANLQDEVLEKECNTQRVIDDISRFPNTYIYVDPISQELRAFFTQQQQLYLYVDMQAFFLLEESKQQSLLEFTLNRNDLESQKYIPWPNTSCEAIDFGIFLAKEDILVNYPEAGEELFEARGCKHK